MKSLLTIVRGQLSVYCSSRQQSNFIRLTKNLFAFFTIHWIFVLTTDLKISHQEIKLSGFIPPANYRLLARYHNANQVVPSSP